MKTAVIGEAGGSIVYNRALMLATHGIAIDRSTLAFPGTGAGSGARQDENRLLLGAIAR